MIPVGFFSEMHLYADNGEAKENVVDKINYDREKVIIYLSERNRRLGGCPKTTLDCITGKEIAPSFSVYSDGEYEWCDFLVYHIKNYNIKLPQEFIDKIGAGI